MRVMGKKLNMMDSGKDQDKCRIEDGLLITHSMRGQMIASLLMKMISGRRECGHTKISPLRYLNT